MRVSIQLCSRAIYLFSNMNPSRHFIPKNQAKSQLPLFCSNWRWPTVSLQFCQSVITVIKFLKPVLVWTWLAASRRQRSTSTTIALPHPAQPHIHLSIYVFICVWWLLSSSNIISNHNHVPSSYHTQHEARKTMKTPKEISEKNWRKNTWFLSWLVVGCCSTPPFHSTMLDHSNNLTFDRSVSHSKHNVNGITTMLYVEQPSTTATK